MHLFRFQYLLSFAVLGSVLPAQDGVPVALGEKQVESPGGVTQPTARIDHLLLGGTRYLRREVRASSFEISRQHSANLSMGPSGELLVTWESRRQRDGLTGVYFQKFDVAGRRLGHESFMHSVVEKVQHAPAGLAGEQPWLAWESFDKFREGGVLNLSRGTTTQPIRIGAGQTSDVTLLSDGAGGVIAAFVQFDEHGRSSVWQQRFDKDTNARGAAVRLSENATLPVLASQKDGHVAAWAVLDTKGRADGLAVQRFDGKGVADGKPTRVVGRGASGAIEPSIAALSTGGFVLAWHDRSPKTEYYDVMAQRFDANAKAEGKPVLVATAQNRLSGACVAATAHAGGRFCVAWNRGEGHAVEQDIVARIYNVNGKPLSESFVVTKQSSGDQSMTAASGRQRLAYGPGGALAIAWSGDAGLGDESAAHLTLLLPAGHAAVADARDVTARPLVAALAKDEPTPAELPAQRPHDPPVFFKHFKQDRGNFRTEGAADPGFVSITNTGWTPPDPRIAVGPNHVVEMVNGGIAFFKKDGTRTFFQNIVNAGGFWGAQGAQGFVFDPRVVFDAYSGRFIAMASELVRNVTPRQGYYCIAVSDDDDPNGTWHKYRMNVTAMARGYFVDYPHLGVDEEAIYISTNNFNTPFNHTTLMLPKAPMLVGANPGPGKFIRDSATTSGALCAQRGDRVPGGIMVSTGGSSTIELHIFQNPLTSPTLTTARVAVPSYGSPPQIPQQGTTSTLNSVGTRIMQIAVRNKQVYAIHTIGKGGRGVARWYQFDLGDWPTSGAPRLVQSGDIDLGVGVHSFLPGIGVDIYGNVCACYARSGSTELPSIGRAFRRQGDPRGTMNDRTVSFTSATFYTRTRWGDYSSVVLDPRDQATFWYCHEYASTTSRWNTWVGSVRAQRPTLTADKATLSASSGGAVTFRLDNPAYANQTFIMVCGWSGTSPGVRMPAAPQIVNLDVNLDALTTILAANMNTPTFSNFFGTLDASGQATSIFRLPPIPSLVGRTIHFAYGQGDNSFDFASETVDVRLTN